MSPKRGGPTVGHVVMSLDVGGLERVVATLSRAQHQAGARVVVYCIDRPGALAAPLIAAGVPVHCVRRRPRGFDAGTVVRLARMLRADGVSLAHCHNHGALVYGALAARLAGCARVVYTVHGANASGRRTTAHFQRLGLLREVVFVSGHTRGVARGAGMSHGGHVHTIVNGVDAGAFAAPEISRRSMRGALAIPENAGVCGIVARLAAVKDHRTLFEAVRFVRAARPDVRCLVVGDGELRADLEAAAWEMGLDAAIHLVGARNNVRDYLAAMDVFVLSSVTEGLSMTLLEAMAAGLPVVATRVGGNPEVVVDGETGLLVPPRDAKALAAAIGSLLEHPERARAMGAAGRARVHEQFSLDAMVGAYASVYAASLQEVGAS
jgi:glycosyltransferase involved in cell wall biosynthesis